MAGAAQPSPFSLPLPWGGREGSAGVGRTPTVRTPGPGRPWPAGSRCESCPVSSALSTWSPFRPAPWGPSLPGERLGRAVQLSVRGAAGAGLRLCLSGPSDALRVSRGLCGVAGGHPCGVWVSVAETPAVRAPFYPACGASRGWGPCPLGPPSGPTLCADRGPAAPRTPPPALTLVPPASGLNAVGNGKEPWRLLRGSSETATLAGLPALG